MITVVENILSEYSRHAAMIVPIFESPQTMYDVGFSVVDNESGK